VSTAALAESGQDSIAKPDYKGVRAAIVDIFDKDEDLGPFFVRLAWHSSGSYSQYDRTGGSQGACMRFKPEADYGGNAGLDKARALLEPVKAKFPLMSYADLYIYAANVCIEEMGGPA
jgi:cytochrome c peroxidase